MLLLMVDCVVVVRMMLSLLNIQDHCVMAPIEHKACNECLWLFIPSLCDYCQALCCDLAYRAAAATPAMVQWFDGTVLGSM